MKMNFLLGSQWINLPLIEYMSALFMDILICVMYFYAFLILIGIMKHQIIIKNHFFSLIKLIGFSFIMIYCLKLISNGIFYYRFDEIFYIIHPFINLIYIIITSIFFPHVSSLKEIKAQSEKLNSKAKMKVIKEKFSRGDIVIGTTVLDVPRKSGSSRSEIKPVCLNLEDMKKHIFICGMSGFGKTTLAQSIIFNLAEHFESLGFLIVELKDDYRSDAWESLDFIYLFPGINFSIDIFDFHGGSPEIHAKRLFTIMKELYFDNSSSGELSPQMIRVFAEVLVETVKNYDRSRNGWDLFLEYLDEYFFKKRNEISQLELTISAIKSRLFSLISEPLKSILSNPQSESIDKILDRRIIINPRSIYDLGGEPSEISLLLSIIFKKLWEKNLNRGRAQKIEHVTVIDDAQYFIPQHTSDMTLQKVKYIEDIALIERGTGELLITIATRPNVSENILSNAGILAIFASNYDISKLNSMLSQSADSFQIGELNVGQCLLKTPGCVIPIKVNVELPKNTKKKLANKKKMKEVLEFVKS